MPDPVQDQREPLAGGALRHAARKLCPSGRRVLARGRAASGGELRFIASCRLRRRADVLEALTTAAKNKLALATRAICQTDAIRTTLDIDDDLMRTLLARLPGRSKTDAIEHAVGAFLANDAVDRLKKLAGTLEIEDPSPELRSLDRTT